jgi:hypothetical protein
MDPSNMIPQFFFPKGKPIDDTVLERDMKRIDEVFVEDNLSLEEFKQVTGHICNLPK